MVMIKDKEGIERFSISTELNKFYDRIKEKIYKEDSMTLGILWGDVGSGKSIRAMQGGYVVDHSLSLTRVCFNKEEFIRGVVNSRKQSVIGDEGIALFFSRGSMTKEGRLMAELMAQIRQKNLFVLICVPELLSVDWLVLKAANFVGYVWENVKDVRGVPITYKGNMALYPEITGDEFKTRILHYLRTKRRNPYAKITRPAPYHIERGNAVTYKPYYPVGEEAYRAKKESILDRYKVGSLEEQAPKGKIDRVKLDVQFDRGEWDNKYLAHYWDVKVRVIQLYKKEWKTQRKRKNLSV